MLRDEWFSVVRSCGVIAQWLERWCAIPEAWVRSPVAPPEFFRLFVPVSVLSFFQLVCWCGSMDSWTLFRRIRMFMWPTHMNGGFRVFEGWLKTPCLFTGCFYLEHLIKNWTCNLDILSLQSLRWRLESWLEVRSSFVWKFQSWIHIRRQKMCVLCVC